MTWYFLLKNCKNVFTSKKKKKNWPVLIQVKPTIAILNRSKPAIIFQDKELDINHEEEEEDEEDENDYSVRNNRTIQLFSVARDRGVFVNINSVGTQRKWRKIKVAERKNVLR